MKNVTIAYAVAILASVSALDNLRKRQSDGYSQERTLSHATLHEHPLVGKSSRPSSFFSANRRKQTHLGGLRFQQSNNIDQGCVVTTQVTPKSRQGKTCPIQCPLYVQDKTDDKFCSFRCVAATIESCRLYNPKAPVPDMKLGICRACRVSGCHTCEHDGTDTCVECKPGHRLENGKCINQYTFIWYIIIGLVVAVVLVVVLWICNLFSRPVTNKAGLDRGLQARSSAKLHQPRDSHGRRKLWPRSTNLLTTVVAGPGVLHLFNFQFALILWAACVLLAWVFLSVAVDTDFFVLGTASPGRTPRDHCIIIQWGFMTQQRLMHAKVMFLGAVYVASFLMAIGYSIWSHRKHQRLDAGRCSHKDFCAKMKGLPKLSGKDDVETELKHLVQRQINEVVIGVSIGWDAIEKQTTLMAVLDQDAEELMDEHVDFCTRRQSAHLSARRSQVAAHWLTKCFSKLEKYIFKAQLQRIEKTRDAHPLHQSNMARVGRQETRDLAEPWMKVNVEEELQELYSADVAWIVFNTEESRDTAVHASEKRGGLDFRGEKVFLVEAECEPQSVNWNTLSYKTGDNVVLRVIVGFLGVLCALAVWCCCFYLPYAYSVMRTDYANGNDPNVSVRFMFGFIVVAGNGVMYNVCSEISDKIGFRMRKSREICYMLFYCFACVCNVLLDLAMAYQMAYRMMVGLDVKTHDGTPLSDVRTFTERFETYAMQKSLGRLLSDYSWPSTFLVPFLVEPFVVIILPFQVMFLIVRSHPRFTDSTADAYLAMAPMDLSRYADVLLNVMLATLIFFFPGGYVVSIFLGLVVSHIFIYAYDHCRVLRAIPECDYATHRVDMCAQWLLSIPCAILLTCTAFKANCQNVGYACWDGNSALVERMVLLFLAHVVVHTFTIFCVVPLFGLRAKTIDTDKHVEHHGHDYKTCAEMHPSSWFSANPVHCLRSKYIHKHEPPCDYFIIGKDHLLRPNPDLNLYYSVKTAKKETFVCDVKFDSFKDLSNLAQLLGGDDDDEECDSKRLPSKEPS